MTNAERHSVEEHAAAASQATQESRAIESYEGDVEKQFLRQVDQRLGPPTEPTFSEDLVLRALNDAPNCLWGADVGAWVGTMVLPVVGSVAGGVAGCIIAVKIGDNLPPNMPGSNGS